MLNNTLVITGHNNKLLKIDKNDPEVLRILSEYFTITEKEFIPDTHETLYHEISVLEHDENYIYFPMVLLDVVRAHLFERGYFTDETNLVIDNVSWLELSNEWYERFSSNYVTTIDQAACIDAILSKTNGIIQIPTGSGKSEFIVALTSALKEDGNILITVPFNSIKEELITRFNREGIEVTSYFDLTKKINIVQPPGYHNSNNFRDTACITWMNNVKMLLIDECENITDSFSDLLDNQLTSYKYIFGFSASADRYDGQNLNSFNNLHNYVQSTYRVIKYVGTSIVFQKPNKMVRYNKLQSSFGAKRLPFQNSPMEYHLSLKNVITHDKFKVDCCKVMMDNKVDILYIPVSSWDHGLMMMDYFKSLNAKVVAWRSGEVQHNFGEDVVMRNYVDIKNYAKNPTHGKIDVLVSTSVGFLGIDIPQISDVMLYIGTKYNTVIQPIGRAFRHSNPGIWIVKEVGNKNEFFKRCTYRREHLIEKTYQYELKEWNV